MAENAPAVFNVHVQSFIEIIWAGLRDAKVIFREASVAALRVSCLSATDFLSLLPFALLSAFLLFAFAALCNISATCPRPFRTVLCMPDLRTGGACCNQQSAALLPECNLQLAYAHLQHHAMLFCRLYKHHM